MIESGPDMIGDVRSIIVWVMEKIGAFTKLIAWGMEITVPPSATITDDAKIIVSETELIVTTAWLKGKTGRKESRKKGGSELKRSVNGSHCPPRLVKKLCVFAQLPPVFIARRLLGGCPCVNCFL